MKAYHRLAAVIILAGLSSAAAADYYSQYFDSMGPAGTTAPAGWTVRTITGNGLITTVPTGPEMASTVAGSAALVPWDATDPTAAWSTQAGNMGLLTDDPNRLLGTSPSGTRGSLLQLSLNNSSGAPVSRVELRYDMRTFSVGTLSGGFENGTDELPGYSFYYLDSGTWTHLPSLDLSSTGTASATFNLATPVANGANLQFRWFDDNAYQFSPDAMIGIDNVVINIPEPGMLALLAVGAAMLIARRRTA